LKQNLFGASYTRIFSRKITAEKIYLAKLIYETVKQNALLLKNEKIREYGLATFFFTHVVADIFREDDLGNKILETPKPFVTTQKDKFVNAVKVLWELITPDINLELEEYTKENENFFDYKNLFKNSQFVNSMTGRIKKEYTKSTRKNPAYAFTKIYESLP
jgi:hypothetical protein